MTVLRFKNKAQADTIAGILDFSLGLINPKEIKKFNKEMYEYTLELTEGVNYQQDEEIIYLKNDSDIFFILDNAVWILTQEIKDKPNEVYSNSIGLMKQLIQLIKDKQKKEDEDSFIIDGKRKFNPEIEKKLIKHIDKDFLIKKSFNYSNEVMRNMKKLPVLPKRDEVWILTDYIKEEGLGDEVLEDTVVIVNKLTNKKFTLFASEFDEIAEVIK